MGIEENIGFNVFPKQGNDLGIEVDVCFKYDNSNVLKGIIVRDDIEEPFRRIIQLSGGRYILSTECMYSLKRK